MTSEITEHISDQVFDIYIYLDRLLSTLFLSGPCDMFSTIEYHINMKDILDWIP